MGRIGAASLLVLTAFVGVASAQNRYLLGNLYFDDPIYPGTELAYPTSWVALSPNPPGSGQAGGAVSNTATAGWTEVWMNDEPNTYCLQGTSEMPSSTACANSTPLWGGSIVQIEAQQEADHQAGYYGFWSASARHRYWVGDPPNAISSPIFSISVTQNFGRVTPVDGSCPSGYYYDDINDTCIPMDCPILISLGSQKYTLTSEAEGVWFDINGDGTREHLSWTQADSDVAFLAIDRNGNGLIDDGTELFGQATVAGDGNGFDALADLSKVKAGTLTADNGGAFFAKLLLWTDRNHDGISQPDEIEPFSKYFEAIGQGYGLANRKDGNGNQFRWEGFVYAKGPKPLKDMDDVKERPLYQRKIYDVKFVVRQQ